MARNTRTTILNAINDKASRLTNLMEKQNKKLKSSTYGSELVVQPNDEWYEVVCSIYKSYGFTIEKNIQTRPSYKETMWVIYPKEYIKE